MKKIDLGLETRLWGVKAEPGQSRRTAPAGFRHGLP